MGLDPNTGGVSNRISAFAYLHDQFGLTKRGIEKTVDTTIQKTVTQAFNNLNAMGVDISPKSHEGKLIRQEIESFVKANFSQIADQYRGKGGGRDAVKRLTEDLSQAALGASLHKSISKALKKDLTLLEENLKTAKPEDKDAIEEQIKNKKAQLEEYNKKHNIKE